MDIRNRIKIGFGFSCQGPVANVNANFPKFWTKWLNTLYHLWAARSKCLWDGNYCLPLTIDILINRIYTAVDRGRLVTSIRRDTTPSEPIQTRRAPNMGGKTHLIQARPKDMCLSLHFPIHPLWAAKQTLCHDRFSNKNIYWETDPFYGPVEKNPPHW